LLSCLFSPQIALGALKVGDPAPKIQVSRWVQGDEVKEFEGDKVYIVEFWATWCGPCVASIPHLDEIYRKYKDKGLVVIGQNVMEDDAKAVSTFVKGMAGKMSYRVTLDDKTDGGWMAKHWLTAAGQNGIPCAFVVSKKGKIAYIGHPMSLKESLLESLLDEPSTKPASAAAVPAAAAAPSAKAEELARRAENELRGGKLDEAEATIAALHEEIPDNFRYRAGLLDMELLIARKQTDDALQLSKLLCEDYAKDSAVLVSVARCLASAPDASANLLDAAEKIAKPISLASGASKDPAAAVLANIATLRGGNKWP
jgi:thiol-disulfide isomerase/thioredoxin